MVACCNKSPGLLSARPCANSMPRMIVSKLVDIWAATLALLSVFISLKSSPIIDSTSVRRNFASFVNTSNIGSKSYVLPLFAARMITSPYVSTAFPF